MFQIFPLSFLLPYFSFSMTYSQHLRLNLKFMSLALQRQEKKQQHIFTFISVHS